MRITAGQTEHSEPYSTDDLTCSQRWRARARDAVRSHDPVRDSVFLLLVVWLSLLPYVQSLGFYLDDWWTIARLTLSTDQSLVGLIGAAYSQSTPNRPLQEVNNVILYSLFHLQPLGYHLSIGVVFSVTVLMFYLSLRRLSQGRLLSLTSPMLYALMPNFSTTRLWFATFQLQTSMAYYTVGLYASLRIMTSDQWRRCAWLSVAVLATICSVLVYEITTPLLLVNPLLVWLRWRFTRKPDSSASQVPHCLTIYAVSNTVALAALVWLKMHSMTRADLPTLEYAVNLATGAVSVNYGWYFAGIPLVVWTILSHYGSASILVMSVLLALGLAIYLYYVASRSRWPNAASVLRTVIAGLAVFCLGYGILFTTSITGPTPTGISNRLSMAASAGVALTVVGGLVELSSLWRAAKLRSLCFCVLVSLFGTSGFLINNTIASFWVAAYREQQVVLADIRQQFPTLPGRTVFILDGVCPYIGPASVFEAPYHLEGALRIMYDNPFLEADVVRPSLVAQDNGLVVVFNGRRYHYPYEGMVIYDSARKVSFDIPNKDAADHYFETINPDRGHRCRGTGLEGYGARIF
jgi:hypothetical protein